MFDTSPDGILKLARQGESQLVEFKLRLPPQEDLAKLLAAFANSQGGILLLGVRDDGSIEGLTDDEVGRAVDGIHRVAESLFSWPVEVGAVEIKGKGAVYVVVDPAPRAYSPVTTSRGDIFLREGVRVKQVPAENIVQPPETGLRFHTVPPKSRITLFVAMSFRDEEEPALIDYFRAIERAVAETKLPITVKRMDLVEGDYEISQQIMEEIDRSHIVFADFTLSARNVYFELGYARGREKRVIQTARKGTALEFDVRNWRTVFYRNATELEQKLVAEIKGAYAAITSNDG